jgi:hypothetical protein
LWKAFFRSLVVTSQWRNSDEEKYLFDPGRVLRALESGVAADVFMFCSPSPRGSFEP